MIESAVVAVVGVGHRSGQRPKLNANTRAWQDGLTPLKAKELGWADKKDRKAVLALLEAAGGT